MLHASKVKGSAALVWAFAGRTALTWPPRLPADCIAAHLKPRVEGWLWQVMLSALLSVFAQAQLLQIAYVLLRHKPSNGCSYHTRRYSYH